MNRLSLARRTQIIGALVEGNSIRSTERMTEPQSDFRRTNMGNGLYVVYLSFKLDFEHTSNDFLRIGKSIGVWSRPVLHGKKTAGFVVHTKESLEELTKRIRPALDGIYSLDNYWISPAPIAIEAKHNSIDPFKSRVLEGWNRVREARHSPYMPKHQVGK